MSDFYKLLDVPRDASEAEIKKAYRKLAMELHPDRNKGHDAEERFKEVTEAYEILRDPQKRAAYDRYGDAAFARGGRGAGAQGFHHVDLAEALQIFMRDFGGGGGFDSIFGGGQRARGEARRGQDLRVEVSLTMAEVATGAKRSLKIRTQVGCETCGGNGAKAGTAPVPCKNCRGTGEVQRAAQSMFGQFITVAPCPTCRGEGSVIKEPCEKCGGGGYFGRTGMVEFIEMTDGMRQVVAGGGNLQAIKQQMKKEKMQSFHSDGLRLVAEGKTSLEELQRVFKGG